MGNCASEDTTNKGSGIHGERMAKNPNEADVVIDTNPILKKKEVDMTAEANTSTIDETIPSPMNGIRLSYLLNDFVDECGGKEALEGLTTTDECNQFVIPATKDYTLSYCDMICKKAKTNSKLDGVVKTATVFISHAWQYKFLDVLSALEDHFKNELDKIVWFDLVSNNQHKDEAGEIPYEEWATTFKDAIQQLGHTVMVMAPWNDPIPYKRTWCIFEAYCTSVTDAKFEIAMSNNEHRAFIEECKYGPTDIIEKMMSIVNAEKSEARNPKDKERIHSFMKKEVGFAMINIMVFEQLYDWVLAAALTELNRVKKDTLDELDLKYLVGALYYSQGKYDEAKPLYKQCLVKRKKIQGSNHPDTLAAMSNLALLYYYKGSFGSFGKTHRLLERCLAKRRTILGSDHPDTLASMNILAGLYYEKSTDFFTGRGLRLCYYAKAEPLFMECIAKRKTILGIDHPDTLMSMNNLAGLYKSQCENDKAELLYKECLEKNQSKQGLDHPDTLQSMHKLADFYRGQGKYDQAEPLYKECLAKREMILGSDHYDTLASMNNLAKLYLRQGRYAEAEPLLNEGLVRSRPILQSDDPEIVKFLINYIALHDIKSGDELQCDYSSFVTSGPDSGWNQFSL